MSRPLPAPTREYLKPPVTQVGLLGWLRGNLFNTWFNSLLTVLVLLLLWQLLPPLFRWAFVESLWNSSAEACRDIDGACWSVVPRNISFIIFGFFPDGQQWRPARPWCCRGLVIYSKNRRTGKSH